MLQCKRCLDLHGDGCAATHETDAGDPSCVFCLDDVPCPVQRKRLRCATDQKAPTTETPAANTAASLTGSTPSIAFVNRERIRSSDSDTTEQESGVKMQNTPETDAIIAPKICKRPGCETQLGPKNRIGLCPRHVRWTGTSEERPSNAVTRPRDQTVTTKQGMDPQRRPTGMHARSIETHRRLQTGATARPRSFRTLPRIAWSI